ncbi:hypothetical protein ACU8KH_01481 [Lachancea thermotolerans]
MSIQVIREPQHRQPLLLSYARISAQEYFVQKDPAVRRQSVALPCSETSKHYPETSTFYKSTSTLIRYLYVFFLENQKSNV